MIKDCRRGKIDRIYTKSISRFARNTRDCLKNVRELKSLGITIFFEKENIDTANLSDEMMITIMGGLAQEESTSISQNMRWSCQKRMANGTFLISHVPFGYMKSGKEMIINPAEAKVVRRIYADYLSGKGTSRISKDLNADGIPKNQKGEPWNKNVVRYVLTNEKYIGDCLWQKKFTEDVFPFKKSVNRGQVDSYYITDAHEPIISREMFESVQKLLKKQGEYFGNHNFKQYPLSMKVFCGDCGKSYMRKKVNGKIHWVC
jgi:DNA invertase Pin-like site-specific DNA recombinase